jgi:hypothetical protein
VAVGIVGDLGRRTQLEMTVDERRGIAFIPTGTARYDFYGANRHGENLFSRTILLSPVAATKMFGRPGVGGTVVVGGDAIDVGATSFCKVVVGAATSTLLALGLKATTPATSTIAATAATLAVIALWRLIRASPSRNVLQRCLEFLARQRCSR